MTVKNIVLISNQRHVDELVKFEARGLISKEDTFLVVVQKSVTSIDQSILNSFPFTRFVFTSGPGAIVSILVMRCKLIFREFSCKNLFISVNDYQTTTLLSCIRHEVLNIFDDGVGVVRLAEMATRRRLFSATRNSRFPGLFRLIGVRYEYRIPQHTPINIYTRFSNLLQPYIPETVSVHEMPSSFENFEVLNSDYFYFLGQPLIESLKVDEGIVEDIYQRLAQHFKRVYYLPHPSERATLRIAMKYFEESVEYKVWSDLVRNRLIPSKIASFFTTVLFDLLAVNRPSLEIKFYLDDRFQNYISRDVYDLLLYSIPRENLVMLESR